MTQANYRAETREKLKRVSTATLATLLFKRGLRNQFIQDVHPLARKGENMVGPAFTLRYIPAREDLNELAVFRDPEHPQRRAVEMAPEGSVMVFDSRKDARAASAGSILVGCGDVAVWPGDIMVGDGEGVIVIPRAIVDEVADEAFEMTVFEDFVLEQVQNGAQIIGLYPPTHQDSQTAFAEWRKKTGR